MVFLFIHMKEYMASSCFQHEIFVNQRWVKERRLTGYELRVIYIAIIQI